MHRVRLQRNQPLLKPMHHYIPLSICLFASTQVSATTQCYIAGALNPPRQYPGPPTTADCLSIVSRIPSLLPTDADDPTTNEDANLVPLYSSNSPFLPPATFQHGTCVARISCHTEPQPANGWTVLQDVEFAQQQPLTPAISLSEASIFKLWTAAKLATQSATNQCVTNRCNGASWAAVDIPEAVGAWCAVHVLGFNTRGWEHRARMEGVRVWRGSSRGQRGTGGGFRNKFKSAVVDVP